MLNNMDHFHGLNNLNNSWETNSSSFGYSNGIYQAASSGNSTFGVINEFKFLAAKSIRTSTIILAVFNTISAFATAAGIYYDCYVSAKRSNSEGRGSVSVFRCVRGPETYPFILSLGITIQGIIFAVCQSYGLKGLFIPGCSLISQFMWPAIFIVPYIQLVFGLEVTLRAFRKTPFQPRNKWTVLICLVLVKCLLLCTGLVGFFVRPPSFCFASLFWFVAKWAEGGFVLLLLISVVLAICSVVIFLKLTRHAMIEDSERVSASRMVYYLALAVVTNALIVPFFIYLSFKHPLNDTAGLTLSMISTVVANVTGLTTGGLHLFLRSRTISTIGPTDKLAEYERQKMKQQIRMGGTSNAMDFNGHILQPVSGPKFSKTESQEDLVGEKGGDAERGEIIYPGGPQTFGTSVLNPLRSNAVFNATNFSPIPEPIPIPPTPTANVHSRKPSASYTLFPSKNQGNTASVALLPSTAYNPNPQSTLAPNNFPFDDMNEALKPPPSVRTWGRHRRDSSMASSATVQIGLRISNVADIGPLPKSSTEIEREYPQYYPQNELPATTYRPSPLATSNAPSSPVLQSSIKPKDTSTKNTPPVSVNSDGEESTRTLSPTVYNPNSPTKAKTPSPKGVGFNVPRRANTTPIQGTSTPPPTRSRGNSSGVADSRSDWI
ncbi:uncharacterized protein GGS22DRAFT_139389 [Annulohypoxylon maeteangense]|uniref:uncharacterized protein n=1 Tax=Annulohypoxylon maeteangense TaxID=1927788 RepID=UPI0020075195|nr:uncharacterized protein GGS22DRAFT_139389 [Annulohypoxylon maeteangense]KAI0885133.1 hypothetical protein GGS22DRAFT_139389 [Annulohypoxylon maeteangense]